MEALKLELQRDTFQQPQLVTFRGTRTCYNRETIYSPYILNEKIAELKSAVSEGTFSREVYDSLMRRLTVETECCAQYSGFEMGRYYSIVPGVQIDRFNTLELLGCMRASKKRTFMYSLHNALAQILAFLYKEDPAAIENRLRSNCEEHNVDYGLLNYAFCTLDMALIETINLQCLVGVCELLDLDIQDIVTSPCQVIRTICGTIVDISDTAFTAEERLTTLLVTDIAYVLHNILNGIFSFFNKGIEPFKSSRYCMPCSLGFSNAVITTDLAVEFPKIDISLNENTFSVSPITYYEVGASI